MRQVPSSSRQLRNSIKFSAPSVTAINALHEREELRAVLGHRVVDRHRHHHPASPGFLVDDIHAARDELACTPGIELLGELRVLAGGVRVAAPPRPPRARIRTHGDPGADPPLAELARISALAVPA
jgi:hypothetical protein